MSPLLFCRRERRGGTVLALSARLRQRAAHAFAGRAGGLVEVLCGPWARPRNPRRGFLTENSPLDYFPIFLRLPKATKAAGASPPHPHKPFEKGLSENFTCLYLTRARAFGLAALIRPRRP